MIFFLQAIRFLVPPRWSALKAEKEVFVVTADRVAWSVVLRAVVGICRLIRMTTITMLLAATIEVGAMPTTVRSQTAIAATRVTATAGAPGAMEKKEVPQSELRRVLIMILTM